MGMMKSIKLKLLTPCFCAGADQSKPEIRVPSIRGQLRWWFRKLYNQRLEKSVFGGIGKNDGASSKVVLRVKTQISSVASEKVLLHKTEKSGIRNAITPCSFELFYSFRHSATNEQKDAFERTLKVWALLGALGARGNRAAGSVFFQDEFQTLECFEKKIESLKLPESWSIRVSEHSDTPDNLRRIASDTVDNDEFLGYARRQERKASPLKIKIISIENKNHLLIFAESKDVIEGAMDVLKTTQYPKKLGLLEWNIIK